MLQRLKKSIDRWVGDVKSREEITRTRSIAWRAGTEGSSFYAISAPCRSIQIVLEWSMLHLCPKRQLRLGGVRITVVCSVIESRLLLGVCYFVARNVQMLFVRIICLCMMFGCMRMVVHCVLKRWAFENPLRDITSCAPKIANYFLPKSYFFSALFFCSSYQMSD